MEQRKETVQEFLNRGGTIERNPKLLNTITSFWSVGGEHSTARGAAPYVDPENNELKVVSWKSIQRDEMFDEDGDASLYKDGDVDKTYWVTLNKKLDKALKVLEKDLKNK